MLSKIKKIGKLEAYDLSLFICQSYFSNDGSQNFLKSQPILNSLTMPTGLTETIVAWEPKGLPKEKIRSPTANNSLSPKINWLNS